ncbi:hypothetical protein [Amycolatopsis sp.]|jgi:hypothetical protein|uniref:hypothetical protein n=1 Tax=Amycolatopsis sp. TaxID=37632 RepID=UPI002E0BC8E6|nr:hypothetical protein [Amycolatopsis sp.]
MSGHEELIKEALVLQASRAPSGERVLSVVRQPVSRRPLVLTGVVALVIAIAVGIPFALRPSTPDPATFPAAAAAGSKLKYGATWLPDGFRERFRASDTDGWGQVRKWANGPMTISLGVNSTRNPMWTDAAANIESGYDKVDIGGVTASYSRIDGGAKLTWIPEPGTVLLLTLRDVPDMRTVAVEVAGSVRPDGISSISTGLEFGRLPVGLASTSMQLSGVSPETGAGEIVASGGMTTLTASLSREPARVDGQAVVVRGRQGVYAAPVKDLGGFSDGVLAVELDGGRWLVLRSPQVMSAAGEQLPTPLGSSDLVAVADSLTVSDTPDHSWIGTR